jgi:hypothetical protein
VSVVDLMPLMNLEIDIIATPTYKSYDGNDNQGGELHAMNIPVEIWIEIFHALPDDATRWRLAQINTWFFSIFQNWVGFHHIALRYPLSTLVYQQTVITEITTTTNFAMIGMNVPYYFTPMSDMQIIGNRNSIGRQTWGQFRHGPLLIAIPDETPIENLLLYSVDDNLYNFLQTDKRSEIWTHPHLARIPLLHGSPNSRIFPQVFKCQDYKWLRLPSTRKPIQSLIPATIVVYPQAEK